MLEVIRRLGVFPHSCVLELTLACNFRCKHCGSYAGTPRPDELSLDEWLRVCDELADLHCERLTLGGGEPLMNPHWDTITKHAVGRGMMVNVISNGSLWTDEHSRRAKDAGLTNVGFSIDGLEATHDRVRCFPGSFRRIMAAIESCHRHGVRVTTVTAVNKLNMGELLELRELLGSLGIRKMQCQLGTPSGAMRDHPELVIEPIDLLELVPLLSRMRHLPGNPALVVTDNVGYFGKYERDLREPDAYFGFWLGCRAGMQNLGIESNGNVKGCLSLPSERHGRRSFVEGNVREQSLRAIWERPGAFADTREFKEDDLGGFCRQCNYRDICRGGCLWMSYACSGDPRDHLYCFYRVAVEQQRWDLLDPEDAARWQAAASGD